MIEVDQFKEYSEDEIKLGRAVSVLIEALYDKEGKPVDIADKKGREALIRAIANIPKEIPANLSEEDRKLLKCAIQECKETKQTMKTWFWWVVGLMFLASSTISLCAVMLLK